MTIATISEQDWQNVIKQLRTLVDIYCDLNEDTYQIKELLKKLVKGVYLNKKKRKSTKRKSTCKG